jgi:hypothetical protein
MKEVRDRFPMVKRLTVGVKGALDYSTMFTGVVTQEDPITGIRECHSTTSTSALYPFFYNLDKEPLERDRTPR